MEACQPFWRDSSGHLTLEQGQCYYVVELDGTVYLMRYCVENKANMATMSYKVFGISPMVLTGYNGSEGAYANFCFRYHAGGIGGWKSFYHRGLL